MNYVYQMFSDIAMLVHNQAEDLDNIELNLNKAKDYMEKAVKNLVKAKEQHQKTRKVINLLKKNYKFYDKIEILENVHSFNRGSDFISGYNRANVNEAHKSIIKLNIINDL